MFIVDKELKALIERGELQIFVGNGDPPFDQAEQIGASTIDLRLSRVFRKYKPEVNTIDLTQVEETEIIELPLGGELLIQPGELILGLTVEIVKLPANISGFIAVRSSIARLGLSVVEQPLIHPGYSGSVALQLKNNIDRPIKIKPLMAICQVMFLKSAEFAEKPYGSSDSEKYFGETDVPLAPQLGGEFDKDNRPEDTPIDFAFVTALPYDRALAYEANEWRKKIKVVPPDRLHLDVQAHFGAIASGDKVLADATTLQQLLKECPDLLAVGMEGGGVARAASHQSHPPRFLEIRSICDYGDKNKNDRWQEFASEAAAVYAINFLCSRPVPPLGTEINQEE